MWYFAYVRKGFAQCALRNFLTYCIEHIVFADVRTGDAAPGDAQVNAQRGLQELRALIVRQIANGPAPVGTGGTCVRKVFARFTFRNILIRYFENVAFHYVGTVFAHVPFRDLLTYNFKHLCFACVRKVFDTICIS